MERRIFKLTSNKTGNVTELTYQNEVIVGVMFTTSSQEEEISAARMHSSFDWVLSRMSTPDAVAGCAARYGYELEEVTLEVQVPSFEEFWEVYGYKVGKKEAQDRWQKLSAKNKILAYQFIGKYQAECRQTGAFKMYPKTYLHRQVWVV